MNITEVLSAAKRAGITFYLEQNKLAFKAPKGAFPPELKKQVLLVKGAIPGAKGSDVTIKPSVKVKK